MGTGSLQEIVALVSEMIVFASLITILTFFSLASERINTNTDTYLAGTDHSSALLEIESFHPGSVVKGSDFLDYVTAWDEECQYIIEMQPNLFLILNKNYLASYDANSTPPTISMLGHEFYDANGALVPFNRIGESAYIGQQLSVEKLGYWSFDYLHDKFFKNYGLDDTPFVLEITSNDYSITSALDCERQSFKRADEIYQQIVMASRNLSTLYSQTSFVNSTSNKPFRLGIEDSKRINLVFIRKE